MTSKKTDPVAGLNNMVEILRWRASHQAHRTAYIFLADGESEEGRLTYRELDHRARAIAAELQDLGAAGERILLLYPAGLDYVAAFFGCLYAGATAVPAYPPRPNRPMPRIRSIVADAESRIALTTSAVYATMEKRIADLPDLQALEWRSTDALGGDGAEAWKHPDLSDESIAFLQYTSGSTASPKGVMVGHGNLMHNEELIARACGHRPDTPCVSWLPLYHDLGLIGNMIQSTYVGTPCTLMAPVAFLQRPLRWLQAITKYGGHTSGGPNFAYELAMAKISEEEREKLDLSSWKIAFNGAEPVRHETLERFAKAFAPYGFSREALYPCYGLAETTLIVSGGVKGEPHVSGPFRAEELGQNRIVRATAEDVKEGAARFLVGSGRPLEGMEVAVVDAETLRTLPEERVGEIWVRGGSVTQGYWGRPETTEETFHAYTMEGEGPYLRTGDLGFLADGELYITGRLKDLIIIRGTNHYPQDIELTTERSHRALRPGCGAAFSVDVEGEERLVVVQEVERGARDADAEEIATEVRKALTQAHELRLSALVLIKPGSIPKTTSGKIQRRKTKQLFQGGELEVVGEWREAALGPSGGPSGSGGGSGGGPGSSGPGGGVPGEGADAAGDELRLSNRQELIGWLTGRTASIVGLSPQQIDPHASLLDYGLDSLRAIELMHGVQELTGVSLDLDRLFDGPSVVELADRIEKHQEAGELRYFPTEVPDAVGEHPLSHGQRALWFLHRMEPDSAAYNMASAVRVSSNLDVEALRRAFEQLVERHPALRTTFRSRQGEPRQIVHAQGRLDFIAADASGRSADQMQDELAAEARRPFDLEAGPLMRVRVWTRVAADHVLMLTVHHIVSDFWSMAVLLRELAALYTAELAGEKASLPAPVATYPEFIRWQREMLEGPEGDRLSQYWSEALDGELPVLDLPIDRPRPPVQTYHGAVEVLRLGPSLSRRLRERTQEARTTLFTTLLAAFQVLLARYSGQRDILVGAPAAGRRHARLAGLIGYFVNPLTLRGDLSGEPTFREFLGRVSEVVKGGFEHQDYPFPLLVTDLQPDRDPSRSPLFQAMFTLQAAPTRADEALIPFALGQEGATVEVGGLTLEHLELSQGLAQFDLSLSMGELGSGDAREITATLDYNTDLFDAATIRRMGRNLQVLIEAIAADPDRSVDTMPVISAEERRQVIQVWNNTRTDYPSSECVHNLVEVWALQTPDAVAVVHGGEYLTYGELDRMAEGVASRLRSAGVVPEELVAIACDRSVCLVAAMLGVLKTGAGYVPLDLQAPPERLSFILDDARVCRILTNANPAHGGADIPWAGNREVIALTPGSAVAEPPEWNDSFRHCFPESAACLIYTSGSTGQPKGVVLVHRGLVNLVYSFIRSYNAGTADAILPMTSVAFSSFAGEVWPLLAAGGRVVLPLQDELLDPRATADLIARTGVSILSAVPSVISTLNAMADRLPKLRLILSGGDALAAGDIDKLLGAATVVNGYGLTETSICSTIYPLTREDFIHRLDIPIGKAVMNHRLYVLSKDLEMVPVGATGELFLAGEGLARGLLDRPRDTAQRFLPDPYFPGERMYRTGDLAAYGADGNLFFRGRRDFQVKIRGYRIELGDIESALGRHPDVREAVVSVRTATGEPAAGTGSGDRRLVGYIVFEEGRSVSAADLAAWARETLPQYMVPAAFVFLDSLPFTRNGKVDLQALPAPEVPKSDAPAVPAEGLEGTIAGVWSEVLGVPAVGLHDNFFDLGGHSLLLAKLQARLQEELGEKAEHLTLVDLFRYPTVETLARHLAPRSLTSDALRGAARGSAAAAVGLRAAGAAPVSRDIAVIAVSGRFPGAETPDELWENVVSGVESISRFTDEEVLANGVDPDLVADPNYIKAKGILGNIDQFDAGFFNMSPRGAELTDPQHRVFLEVAWEALERGGYDPDRYPGRVGVFAGQSMNTYWLKNLYYHIDLVASVDSLAAAIGNDKDSLTTEVSYRMNLTGPSVLVQSSSSTSLTAIHYACQSLLAGECDMALSGGASIHVPEVTGYLYHEGGTTDPEGHCRTFSSDAKGFVSGHGVAAVLLKRLEDAEADGDNILAVIKGSACNNDGSVKVSYMAPSVDGHARVVAAAQAAAGVSPDTVTLIEAHGTGTLLGDPIEVAALTQAFRLGTDRTGYCALGSLKTNIGHLDTAAGAAGLIKTVLCLHHKKIPAILNFKEPNPKIDFESSPFFVNTELRDWEVPSGLPRRAGVSSLGMGGTNTHVVLEEAPEQPDSGPSRPWQLLRLSAKTDTALEASTRRLARHLGELAEEEAEAGDPEISGASHALADAAYTLDVGRKAFEHRRIAVVSSAAEGAELLASLDPERVLSGSAGAGVATAIFVFSGQGSQYVGMGRDLYESEPFFREEVDRAAELLLPHLELDIRQVLYPDRDDATAVEEAEARLAGTDITQPALFVVEHALARLLMSWGVNPRAMVGHSIGEYTAAVLAGVMDLADALRLVAERGRLMMSLPPGSMLAVYLPEEEVERRLAEKFGRQGGGVEIATVNRPGVIVVSGPSDLVAGFKEDLEADGVDARPLHTSHAFHSAMMEPILKTFTAEVAKVKLRPPSVPYLSNVTGTWIRPEEATDPAYYARHLRSAVRFSEGVEELLKGSDRVIVEVGPGNALATNVRQHPALGALREAGKRPPVVLDTLPHARHRETSAQRHLLTCVGRMWTLGVTLDSAGFWAGEARRRTVLPTYPFERRRYWVEPGEPAGVVKKRSATDPAEWLWAPVWKQARRPLPFDLAAEVRGAGPWLVFAGSGEGGLGRRLARRLADLGAVVSEVLPGEGFAARGGEGDSYAGTAYTARPGSDDDLAALLAALETADRRPKRVLHLWTALAGTASDTVPDTVRGAREGGLETLLALARVLGSSGEETDISVVTGGLSEISGLEPSIPEQALALGAVRSVPQELPNLTLRSIDVVDPEGDSVPDALLDRVLAEAAAGRRGALDLDVALRGAHRWAVTYEPVLASAEGAAATRELASAPFRDGGVYLITGGLGGIGLAVAEELAREHKARLVLLGRSALPPREEWASLPDDHPAAEKVAAVRALEEMGAEVMAVSADVTDREALAEVRRRAEERFGPIHGVIHSAGVPAGALVTVRERAEGDRTLASKVAGTLALAAVFEGAELDFLALFSSVTSILSQLGQADYAAGNAYLDAFALAARRRGVPAVSINWDAWREVGMAVTTEVPDELKAWREENLASGLTTEQGIAALRLALAANLPRVAVSRQDLEQIRRDTYTTRAMAELTASQEEAAGGRETHARPELGNAYAAPGTETERKIAAVWQEILGVQPVGIHDNFFELGGNSLVGLKVISRVKEAFSCDIPVVSLFEGPTVAALAKIVERDMGTSGEADDEPAMEERRSRGARRRERLRRKRSS